MTTHFIEFEIPLEKESLTIQAIEQELAQQGEALRWAITQVDRERQTATIEAVVTHS